MQIAKYDAMIFSRDSFDAIMLITATVVAIFDLSLRALLYSQISGLEPLDHDSDHEGRNLEQMT